MSNKNKENNQNMGLENKHNISLWKKLWGLKPTYKLLVVLAFLILGISISCTVSYAGNTKNSIKQENYNNETTKIKSTGRMKYKDIEPLCILLPNNNVLVLGGGKNGTGAQIFDPNINKYRIIQDSYFPHHKDYLLLDDGTVFLYDSGYDRQIELFDYKTETFKKLDDKLFPYNKFARRYFLSLGNNRLLVVTRGMQGMRYYHVFDLNTMKYQTLHDDNEQKLLFEKYGQPMKEIIIDENTVMIITFKKVVEVEDNPNDKGIGYNTNEKRIEEYNIVSLNLNNKQYKIIGTYRIPRYKQQAFIYKNLKNSILIYYPKNIPSSDPSPKRYKYKDVDFYLLDLKTNSLKKAGTSKYAGSYDSVELKDGRVLFNTGKFGSSTTYYVGLAIFDPKTGKTSLLDEYSLRYHTGMGLTLLHDGSVLINGGYKGGFALDWNDGTKFSKRYYPKYK